jgi:uncharacterized coiled-coil protein SlyX
VSKPIRHERDRRIAELEALVVGQGAEIDRLNKQLDNCEGMAVKLALALKGLNEAARRVIEEMEEK